MLKTRVIPTLLVQNKRLVKGQNFCNFRYVGDPCNTIRIFNELEVDELIFLDIAATIEGCEPDLILLAEIANESFMPMCYGGGIRSLEIAKSIFDIGFEKIVLNTNAIQNPKLITKIAKHFGSQAVIVSIDVKSSLLGKSTVRTMAGKHKTSLSPLEWAIEVESLGAGELLLTSIDREGTWEGFDLELVKKVTDAVSIPVIAHGGAGCLDHVSKVVKEAGASAVALGSMVVFQKKDMGVLINYPERKTLDEILS